MHYVQADLPVWIRRSLPITRSQPVIALSVFIIAILFQIFRRIDQLWAPSAWVEDVVNLRHIIDGGVLALAMPVNGYLQTPSTLIALLSTKISFFYFPELSYFLILVFTGLVAVAIALSPTILRFPVACAISVFLIPSDPEVFAVGLFAFWWGTLLVILALLWHPEGGHPFLRAFFIVLGGFSSPIIIGLTPLFILRAVIYRRLLEFYMLGAVLVVTLIQASFILVTPKLKTQPMEILSSIFHGIEGMFGFYLIRFMGFSDNTAFVFGLFLLAGIVFALYSSYRRQKINVMALILILFVTIALSFARANPGAIHPVLAGPRYFFFPFILLSWMLIQLLEGWGRTVRWISIMCLVLAGLNMLTAFDRRHDRIDWQQEVSLCAQGIDDSIPIHTDGKKWTAWSIQLSQETCRKLLTSSIFPSGPDDWKTHMLGYTAPISPLDLQTPLTTGVGIDGHWAINGYSGGAGQPPVPAAVYGSWAGADSNTGTLRIGPFSLPDGETSFGLLAMAGQTVDKLSLRILDGQNALVNIVDLKELPKHDWRALRVPLPAGTRGPLIIEAVDSDTAWGAWFAVSVPYHIEKNAGPCELDRSAGTLVSLDLGAVGSTIDTSMTLRGKWQTDSQNPTIGMVPLPMPVYESWAGADSNVGTLLAGPFPLPKNRTFGLLAVAGPNSAGLNITIRDGRGARVACLPAGPLVDGRWKALAITFDAASAPGEVFIEAVDDGREWGGWLAVSAPFTIPGF
jgi:hypothetical protein